MDKMREAMIDQDGAVWEKIGGAWSLYKPAQSAAVPVVGEVVAISKLQAELRDRSTRNARAGMVIDARLKREAVNVIETLAAELDALRKDAERYHYIRDRGLREAGFKGTRILFAAQDEAIDAAIAGEKSHG